MGNTDTQAAWTYHATTKHSPESVRSSRHVLDWANQPLSFKLYTSLEPISLPRLGTAFIAPPSSRPPSAAASCTWLPAPSAWAPPA